MDPGLVQSRITTFDVVGFQFFQFICNSTSTMRVAWMDTMNLCGEVMYKGFYYISLIKAGLYSFWPLIFFPTACVVLNVIYRLEECVFSVASLMLFQSSLHKHETRWRGSVLTHRLEKERVSPAQIHFMNQIHDINTQVSTKLFYYQQFHLN